MKQRVLIVYGLIARRGAYRIFFFYGEHFLIGNLNLGQRGPYAVFLGVKGLNKNI